MLLLFCVVSHTGFGQQIVPTINDPSLELLYSLLLCTPTATSVATTDSVSDNSDTAIATLVNTTMVDSVAAEIQAAIDAETEVMLEKFAEMIEEEPQELGNLRLYRFIDDWYGVRYKYGGTTIRGIDCSAFSQKVYNQIYCVGLKRTSRQQHKYCEKIKYYDEAEEGDLVFFKIHRTRVSHVGIYLANGYFVHASRSRGVMISNLADKYWKKRYAGCGRMERLRVQSSESGWAQQQVEVMGQ